MASTKPATTTRKSSPRKPKDAEPAISRVRWAGVALVVAALCGAIVLAVVSPTDPGSSTAGIPPVATPEPASSPMIDAPIPAERPSIVTPTAGGPIAEIDIEVMVAVPDTELKKRQLKLVILRDGVPIATKSNPKTDGQQEVGGVRLLEGLNTLTAALEGPGGGLGPESEPVVVKVDLDAPELAITSPANKFKTFDDSVVVTGTSEPGAEVVLNNGANSFSQQIVVGPAGTFDLVVPLKKNANEITIQSVDQAGMDQVRTVIVTRKDGKPVIELVQVPKQVKRSTLPKDVRIVVEVTDVGGDKMEGAAVSFSLGGSGRTSDGYADETNTNGRAVWVVQVEPGATSSSDLNLNVEVTSPYGVTRSTERVIPIS